MCLVALALDRHPRFPLVVAANRDEYAARPAEPLSWWTPPGATTAVLAGRDLTAGGTWMGLGASGRIALLTNVRAPGSFDPEAPSRGRIVTDWLTSSEATTSFCARVAERRHNGFNLVAADLVRGDWFWASNGSRTPQALAAGVHGVSNASLDTPWPKVVALKRCLADALEAAASVDALASALFRALADRTLADDALLPSTGVPRDVERGLSSAYVDMPERGYRTRCSTVLISERSDGVERLHAFERTFEGFDSEGAVPDTTLRRFVLEDWPLPNPRGHDASRGNVDRAVRRIDLDHASLPARG